jgi:hypothetical protein
MFVGRQQIKEGDTVSVTVRHEYPEIGLVSGTTQEFVVHRIVDGDLVTVIRGTNIYLTGTSWFSDVQLVTSEEPSCL